MAFERPTLQALIDQTQRDFEARLPGADARIHNSLINVLARVHAGALHGMYGYLESVRNNAFLIDPDDEYLELMASRWGVERLTNTTPRGNLVIYSHRFATSVVVVPEGSIFYDPSTGRQFETLSRIELTNIDNYPTSSVSDYKMRWNIVPIKSLQAGDVDVPEETELYPMHYINGVGSAYTYGEFTGGESAESNTDLLARLLDRWRRPPMGGTKADFVSWALSADEAVTRAWALSPGADNPGTVTILYATDTENGAVTPTSATTGVVRTVVQANAPICANIVVEPVTVTKVNVTLINESFVGDVDVMRTKFEAAIRAFFRRESVPSGVVRLSRLQEAISAVEGEESFTLQYPTTDLQAGAKEIFDLGAFS